MPRISVIVPVYNVEKYIDRCVQSILAQTFSDFELILVDDGSSDYSGAICDDYAVKDSRIVVIHKENGGVSSARNLGLDMARGEYILFVDSDDWVRSEFLQDAVNICEKLSLDIYLGGFQRIGTSGRMHSICISQTIDACHRDLSEKEYTELLRKGYISSVCGKLIRRGLIGQLHFREGMRFGEDLVFVFDLLRKTPRCYAVTTPYYYYADTDNSLTKQYDKDKLKDVVDTYRILLKFSEDQKYQGEFLLHIQQRWQDDILLLQNKILYSQMPVVQKYKLLSILMSDCSLRRVVRQSDDKYCRRYCAYPSLQICYHYYLAMRKYFMDGKRL